MANKRFFNRLICEADAFTDLSDKTQLLYYHLNFNADDEGFIDNSKQVMSMMGAKKKHLQDLIDLGYIIEFDSKVYAVTHWWVHNKHDNRDMKKTTHTVEKSMLEEDGVNHIYRLTRRISDGKLNNTTEKETITNPIPNNNGEENQQASDTTFLPTRDKIMYQLKENEIEKLAEEFDNILDLFELVDNTLQSRKEKTPINNPYMYVKAIAERNGFKKEEKNDIYF